MSNLTVFVEQAQKHFASFQFLRKSEKNSDNYDLFFTHGSKLANKISEERFKTVFIDLLDSLVFLETWNLCYPIFDENCLTMYENQEIKLLHPLCSDSFLEIFLNQIPSSAVQKQRLCKQFI